MIIVDTALARRCEREGPIRVGIVGAGFVARNVALQIVTSVPGLKVAAIANRTLAKARTAYADAGVNDVVEADSRGALQVAIENGRPAVTSNLEALCSAPGIEAIIEATGHVEYGTRACFEAIRNGKHVILLGAETDASVGPILKRKADAAGVVFTYTDGDEPGVAMNLYRFLDSMGCRPVLMGQLKGFLDRYRTPETQRELAVRIGQNPAVLASFADGSKLALEAAIMGNATGFVPLVRGMHGHACGHVNDLLERFRLEDFAQSGSVDYALGAAPHTGAFVICTTPLAAKQEMLAYLKMGRGPLYMFYTPYHLPPWQVCHSVARAVLFGDATIAPKGAPVCDTIAYAKKDLKRGEALDGMGGFACYGLVERYELCLRARYLPIALSTDCRLLRDVAKDTPLTYDDVLLPDGRLCDRLRDEQNATFFPPTAD